MRVIIQGSNNPLVIKFDTEVAGIPVLVITLWCDLQAYAGQPLKTWARQDMAVSGDTAVCPITENETKAFPKTRLMLEAKGLDGDGNTIFWDEYPVDVKNRRDKVITLTQMGG